MKKICWDQGLLIYGEKNEGLDRSRILQGYTAKFAGMAEIMKESFESLGTALIIGIIFIYMILAAQFNKMIPPLAIMFALPLSVVGIFGAMWLTDQSMNIMAQISIIMLMGLVAKNAILLVDYTELLRREGKERNDAIIEGGTVRLRPILMTAFSTIFGMLPAAISMSEGAEMRKTMAICAIGGLVTSTFLTLIVVPVAYSLLEDIAKTRIFKITARIFLVLGSTLLFAFLIAKYILNIDLPV
jgi:HAE1 family hydrophobic/amphiphilic exporter-1